MMLFHWRTDRLEYDHFVLEIIELLQLISGHVGYTPLFRHTHIRILDFEQLPSTSAAFGRDFYFLLPLLIPDVLLVPILVVLPHKFA